MKKTFWLVVLLAASALCMAFGLTACGETKSDGTAGGGSQTEQQKPDESEQGGEQKPDKSEQGGEQKPDEGEQGGEQKPDEGEQGGSEQKPDTRPASVGLEYVLVDEELNVSETGTAYSVVGLGECKDTEIVIPSEHEGKPVIAIGRRAFLGRSELTEITIPNSVTQIGDSAFYGCSGLKKVNVTDLAAWCNTSFEISFNYGANPLALAGHLYVNGQEVTELKIPDSVTSIGDGAFYGFSELKKVTISNNVTSIGRLVFAYCIGLTEVTIGSSVNSIGDSAFGGCSGLTEITIPDSVTSIGDSVFNRIRDTAKNQKILLKQSLSRA